MPKVALIKCEDYDDVNKAVAKAMGHIDTSMITARCRVLTKPNLSFPASPMQPACTHHLFLKSVINEVKKKTNNIVVAEQSVAQGATAEAFNKAGYGNALQGVKFINMENHKFIARNIPGHKALEKTDISEVFAGADVVITLPKLKTHGMTMLTGAIKNSFAFLHPDERKYVHCELNEQISEAVVDIYSLCRAHIAIIDAVSAMEGDEGPANGNPVHIGYIIASNDSVAADAVAAEITGHNPMEVPIIAMAHERGLGHAKDIQLVGDKLQQKKFQKHSIYLMRNNNDKGKMQPRINEKCKACGTCATICPVDAIEKGKVYFIHDEKCIQCLCCLEACPHNAINVFKAKETQVAPIIGTYEPGYGKEYVQMSGLGQYPMFMAVALGAKLSFDDWIDVDIYDDFVRMCTKYGLHVEPDVIFAPVETDKSKVIGGKNITTTFFVGKRFSEMINAGRRWQVHVHVSKTRETSLAAKRFGWYSVVVDNRSINKPFVDHLRFGLMLGFPDCCVDFFRQYNNWSKFSHPFETYKNTPVIQGKARGSYYCNNFLMDHIFFFIHNIPCSYRCKKTIELAKKVELEIMKVEPDYAKRTIELLKKPLLVFGERNFIIFDGRLKGNQITFSNSQYISNPARAEDTFQNYSLLRNGDSLRLDDRHLIVMKNKKEILRVARKEEWFLIDFD